MKEEKTPDEHDADSLFMLVVALASFFVVVIALAVVIVAAVT